MPNLIQQAEDGLIEPAKQAVDASVVQALAEFKTTIQQLIPVIQTTVESLIGALDKAVMDSAEEVKAVAESLLNGYTIEIRAVKKP
jgi:hypothetical protein